MGTHIDAPAHCFAGAKTVECLGLESLVTDCVVIDVSEHTDTQGQSFPVHRLILGTGKYLVENISDASRVPPTGSQVLVLPMKIKEGRGSGKDDCIGLNLITHTASAQPSSQLLQH
jgi:kynurenine formamidase